MVKLDVLNIRSVSSPIRQKKVFRFIEENKIFIVGILETKVRDQNIDKIRRNTFKEWSFDNNNCKAPRGKIWVTWDKNIVNVNMVSKTN